MLDSVKKAFALFPKALQLLYIIAAVNIVTNIINILTIPAPVDAEMTLGRSLFVIALFFLYGAITLFIGAGMLGYVKELVKNGASTIASFTANGKKYFLKVLALTILMLIAVGIVAAIFLLLGKVVPGALKPVLAILAVLAGIILAILLLLAPYALVGSELGVIASIKKSVQVGRKGFLNIIVVVLVLFLVSLAILIAASFLSGILSLILKPLARYVVAIIMAIVSSIIWILANIAYMNLYLKLESAQ